MELERAQPNVNWFVTISKLHTLSLIPTVLGYVTIKALTYGKTVPSLQQIQEELTSRAQELSE